MPTTTYYALPYPDASSTVDVPRDIKALADKLELWKNGFAVPSGNIVLGSNSDTNARAVNIIRSSGGLNIMSSSIVSGNSAGLAIYENGVKKWSYYFGKDGQITSTDDTAAIYRPIPFATQVITNATASVATSATGTGAVTFSTNRFTQAPAVWATGVGNPAYPYLISVVNPVTTGGCTVSIRHVDGTAASTTINFYILATQMTPTTTPGLMAVPTADDDNTIPAVATCHTSDCENEDVAVDLKLVSMDTPVTCGPCGLPIDDVTTP